MTATAKTQCPDCTAMTADGRLTHDDTCPQGGAIDAVSDSDRAFFESQPGVKEFWRKPSPV